MPNLILNPLDSEGFDYGHIIAADSESLMFRSGTKVIQKFYNADLFDGSEHFYFESLNNMYEQIYWLGKKYGKITIIFHNIQYDWQILNFMKFIIAEDFYGLELKKSLMDKIFYVVFKSKGHNEVITIQFLDSFNYFKTKLSEMGKLIGEKKLNEEHYELIPELWNDVLLVEGKERVQKDTEILYKFFMRFMANDKLVKGISLASTSFNTYRSKYMTRQFSMPKRLISDVLESYRGGRCEPYIINDYPVYLKSYDINSLYPYVMANRKYSYKYRQEVNGINWDNIENGDYNYLYEASYSYGQNKPVRLPIMVRNSKGDLIESYQSRHVFLTGQELLSMYKQSDDIIFRFHKGYEFHADDLFSEFVKDFYSLRKESKNEDDSYFYKIVLNSLYGKFGQHSDITDFIPISKIPELKGFTKWKKIRIQIDGVIYSIHEGFVTMIKSMPEHYLKFPIIASEVTANARLYNFEIQQQIGFNHVYYTDTDSFFIDRDWTIGQELGKMKVEKQGSFRIFDAKSYEYIDDNGVLHRTLKGIPKKAKRKSKEYIKAYNKRHSTDYNDMYDIKQFSSLKNNYVTGQVTVSTLRKNIKYKHKKLNYVQEKDGLHGYPYEKNF